MCAEHSKVVKRREPKCGRCKNHGYNVMLKFHKKVCCYQYCTCVRCLRLVEKQSMMNLSQKMYLTRIKETLIGVEKEKKKKIRAKKDEMTLLRHALLKLTIEKRICQVSLPRIPEANQVPLESFAKVFGQNRSQVPEVSSTSIGEFKDSNLVNSIVIFLFLQLRNKINKMTKPEIKITFLTFF